MRASDLRLASWVLVAVAASCAEATGPGEPERSVATVVASGPTEQVPDHAQLDTESAAEVVDTIEAAPPAPERLAPPTGPLEIRVTGDDYRWLLEYPGPDGSFGTEDDVSTERYLHLPAQREVAVELDSRDYVYTFYVPSLDILEAAVPDQPFAIDFETGPPATYDLLGSQMCNYTHPELLGEVQVQADGEFRAWSKRLAN